MVSFQRFDMSLSKLFIRPVSFRATDDSTSPTSQSSVSIAGGLSVKKSANIGGNLVTTGSISITATDQSTSLSTGTFQTSGGAAFKKNVTIGGNLNMSYQQIINVGPPLDPSDAATRQYVDNAVTNPAQTQITQVGTLNSLTVAGPSLFTSTSNSVAPTSGGSALFSGGVGVAKTLWIGGNEGVRLTDQVAPIITKDINRFTSGTYTGIGRSGLFYESGDWITLGVANMGSSVFNGIQIVGYNTDSTFTPWLTVWSYNGTVSIKATTDSTSSTTGSLIVSGGIAVSKNLTIGGFLNLPGTTSGRILLHAPSTVTTYTLTLPSALPSTSGMALVSDTSGNLSFSNSGSTYSAGTGLTLTDTTFSVNASQTGITSLGVLTGLNSSGIVTITNSTDSNTLTTGSLQVAGGGAFSKSVSIGNSLRLFGSTSGNVGLTSPATVTSYNLTLPTALPGSAGLALVSDTSGNLSFSSVGNTYLAGTGLTLTGTTFSVNAAQTGVISLGVLTGLSSSGIVTISNTTDSSSYNNGALVVAGGVGIAGTVRFNSTLSVSGNSWFTGSNVYVWGTTDTSSITTGALQISGGVAVTKSITVGSRLFLAGSTSGTASLNAPATVTSYTLTLPTALPGTSGLAIVSDTTGKLSYASLGSTYTAGTGLTLTGTTFSVNASQTGITSLGTLTGLTSSGIATITNTTASTSISSGALLVSGGLGVAGRLSATTASVGSTVLKGSTIAATYNTYPTAALTANTSTISGQTLGNGIYNVTASTTTLGNGYNAFDKDTSTYWGGAYEYSAASGYTGTASTTVDGTAQAGEWIQLRLPDTIACGRFTVTFMGSSVAATSFMLAGSNDGTTWNAVADISGVSQSASAQTFITTNTNSFSYFRFIFRAVPWVPGSGQVAKIYAGLTELSFDSLASTIIGTQLQVTSHVGPDTNNAYALGTSNLRFSDVFTSNVNASGNVIIINTTDSTSVATGALQVTGGASITGTIIGGSIISAKALNSGAWQIWNGTTSAGKRWAFGMLNVQYETGSNAGSDFAIYNYSDTGVYVGQPFSITRSTGYVNVNNGLNVVGGVINITNATSNLINISGAGSGPPTSGTRGVGTKIVLFPGLSSNPPDYAIGVDAFTIWQTVPQNLSTYYFKWYGGTTNVMTLDGTGNLTTVGTISLTNATSNTLYFNTAGVGAPTFSTRSIGTKIVLYPGISSTLTDYAIGLDAYTIWNSVPQNSTGNYFKWYGGTTNVMTLDGTGNLTTMGTCSFGYGPGVTTNLTATFQNTGSAWTRYYGANQTTNYWLVGNEARNGSGTGAFVIYANGGAGMYIIWGNTGWSANSDARLKKDITPITSQEGLQVISNLKPVRYNWKEESFNNGKKKLGMIAQEVEEIVPEIVDNRKDDHYLSVNYTSLIPMLVAAIQELQRKVNVLESKL